MIPASKTQLVEAMKAWGFNSSISNAIIAVLSDDYVNFRIYGAEIARVGLYSLPFLTTDEDCLAFFLENYADILETWGHLWRNDPSWIVARPLDCILAKNPIPCDGVSELVKDIIIHFCKKAVMIPYAAEIS